MAAKDEPPSQSERRRAYTARLEEQVLSLSVQLMQVRDAGEEVSPEYVAASEERLAALQEELRERRRDELDDGGGAASDRAGAADGEGSLPKAKGGNDGDGGGSRSDGDGDGDSVVDDDGDSIFAMARRMEQSKVLDDPSCIQGANDDDYWKWGKGRRGKRVGEGGGETARRAAKARSSATAEASASKRTGQSRGHPNDRTKRDDGGSASGLRGSEENRGPTRRTRRQPTTKPRPRRRNVMQGSGHAIRLHQKTSGGQAGGAGKANPQGGDGGRGNVHGKQDGGRPSTRA